MKLSRFLSELLVLAALLAAGCDIKSPPSQVVSIVSASPIIEASMTPTPMLSATPTPIIPTLTATPYPYFEPAGCKLPGADYSLVEVNGWTINQRTLEMLRYASELFNGDPEYLPALITQGSYHDNGAASWGTHLGGGAVDLSVMLPGTYTIDGNNISLMIRALRTAGFAGWFRDANELFPESAVHIHAIAIGDAQLSEPALQQLISEEGYFFGNNGIPVDNGFPIPDRHGGALTCNWMIEMGYPAPSQEMNILSPWQMRLQKAASQAMTETEQQTIAFGEQLGFYPGTVRGLEDLDAPLAIWLMHESGLVTALDAMLFQLPNFRLGSLNSEWRFWAQFPSNLFTRFDFSVSPGNFDFEEWPLMAGDVVLTQSNGEYTHVFMVTQIDVAGSVFSVAPFRQPNGVVVLKSLLVYHPDQSAQGLLENEWSGCTSIDCSEPGGFIVFRRQDLHLPPGSTINYQILAGDTLPMIARKFDSTLSEIMELNPGINFENLPPGNPIFVPVNTIK